MRLLSFGLSLGPTLCRGLPFLFLIGVSLFWSKFVTRVAVSLFLISVSFFWSNFMTRLAFFLFLFSVSFFWSNFMTRLAFFSCLVQCFALEEEEEADEEEGDQKRRRSTRRRMSRRRRQTTQARPKAQLYDAARHSSFIYGSYRSKEGEEEQDGEDDCSLRHSKGSKQNLQFFGPTF